MQEAYYFRGHCRVSTGGSESVSVIEAAWGSRYRRLGGRAAGGKIAE